MTRLRGILGVGIIGVLLCVPLRALAVTPPVLSAPAGLAIAEIKMTGDEFVLLQNNSSTDIPDLSTYWLQYFNDVNPLAPDTKNSSQQLPMGRLAAGQTILLSGSGRATCGAAVADSLHLSLGDSGGFLELAQLSLQAGVVVQTAGDIVSWSSDASGSIQNVPSNSKDPQAVWYRYQNDTVQPAVYPWQQAELHPGDVCQLDVATTVTGDGTPPSQPAPTQNLPQATNSPPATIVSFVTEATAPVSAGPSLPVGDQGLLAPQLSELLPNTAAPATDATGEFVELYNPNDAPFDLSGFNLSTSSTRHYTFPAGTILPAKSFKTFYSSQFTISLSNSGGQVTLLDPLGKIISTTDPYGVAKDGLAWALASGQWYWTTTPTPDKANVIMGNIAPTGGSKSSLSAVNTTTAPGQVQGAATSANTTGTATTAAADVTPVHPWALALVTLAALLYGAYEYRADLGNRIYQLKKYRAARRSARQ